ncbi:MAG: DNA topoisomerase IB [Polyangiales bacterium]
MRMSVPIAEHPSMLPTLQAQQAPALAEEVGLLYVREGVAGITRKRAGKGFTYRGPSGARIADAGTLKRIRALAIPPAYVDVWICADPRGHIQATGRDAKGRKQYRYHARWREVRDAVKFHRMLAFADTLPRVRAATDAHLAMSGLPRAKVLATVVRLLEHTRVRVGNEEYARKNESFGLTTLRNEHATVVGAKVRFEFRGKSGKSHRVDVTDLRLARIVRRCLEIPGQDLFQYVDADGGSHTIGSTDVNEYIRAVAGEDFTAKDFRTWAATVQAAGLLRGVAPPTSKRDERAKLAAAIEAVSAHLGNTPAVCRRSYVHPAVLEAFAGKWIGEVALPSRNRGARGAHDLGDDERFTVALLQRALRRTRPTLEKQLESSVRHARRAA